MWDIDINHDKRKTKETDQNGEETTQKGDKNTTNNEKEVTPTSESDTGVCCRPCQ